MSDDFDPYYRWLSIPPQDQPPHHYQLLGVRLFETDADVITSAADRQMAHLRTFQHGQRAEHSQKLLNEVALAQAVLLDADRRAQYDEQLRSKSVAVAQSRATPLAQPEAASVVNLASAPLAPRGKPSAKSLPVIPLAIGGGVLLLAMVIGLLVAAKQWSAPHPAHDPVLTASIDLPAEEISPPAAANNHSEPPPIVPPVIPPVSPPSVLDPPETTTPTTENPTAEPPTEETTTSPDALPVSPPATEPPVVDEPKVATKPKVPDAATRKAKRAAIADIYSLDRARKPAEKVQLATELLKAAADTTGDPDAQFAMWNAARELAAEASRVRLAFTAIDEIAQHYDVDAAALREATFQEALKSPTPPAEKLEVLQVGLEQIDRLVADDRYAEASKASTALLEIARRSRQREAQAAVVQRRDRSEQLGKKFSQCNEALATLKHSPDDETANLEAGTFFTLDKGNWRRGLPLLARGGSAPLALAAKLDLERPTEAAAQAKLGDVWWDAAADLPEAQQRAARARAAAWYRRALPQLTGLAAAKTQTRVDELAALGVSPMALPGDTIDTMRLGGDGGGPFRELRADHAPIVGFHMNFRVGCVKYLQPRYLTPDGVVDGAWCGHPGGGHDGVSVLAKEGYAVGGIIAKSGNRIDGFRVVFMRLDGDRLDTTDSYESEWFGGRGGGGETLLGGTGNLVIGLHGQQGADLDGAGLVLALVESDGARP